MTNQLTLRTHNMHSRPVALKIKDPGSAITHFIGFLLAILGTTPLLYHAAVLGASALEYASLTVFMISMILLYGASTTYHTFDINPKINKTLKKFDHMMIFVLIAGSYTPVCIIALHNVYGYALLGIVWAMAVIGMVIKFFFVTCPKWVSSVIYIAMGWACILALPQIVAALPFGGFLWLLIGGILYTIGGVIYALKLKALNNRFPNFGSHEIFHLFVMAGSLCHYVVMYQYLLV